MIGRPETDLIAYLSPQELAELDSLLASDPVVWRPLPGPQAMAYHSRATIIGYGGSAGGGKGLALDTPLPTPSGWTTMERVAVGDTLFDAGGEPCTVTAVSEISNNPCFRLTFDDGQTIVADNVHRWVTFDAKERAALTKGNAITGTIRDTAEIYTTQLTHQGRINHAVRVVGVFRYIVACDPIESVPTRCIAVDSPSRMYLAGAGMIPTHNTDLACGKALTQHQKVLILRREATQLTGIIDRFTELLGGRDGFNGAERIWRLPGKQIEFGSTPGLTDWNKYQGRPHDLLVFDEAANFLEAQVRALLGWLRSVDPQQICQAMLTFNPPTSVEGRWIVDFFAPWLDTKHPNPAMPGEVRWFAMVDGKEVERPDGQPFTHAGDLITPMSRTFIPSRVSDNPYLMGTNYMTTLQSLPEPLRSQMLNGDFQAGMQDDPWQVIPTAWVEAAQARWIRPPKLEPMDSVGVDVARGGDDNTIIARRHGMWFDDPLVHPGKSTPDGPAVAGLAISAVRDHAVIHIDVIGVGASPFDFLREARQHVIGVNVSEAAQGADKSGRLRFFNLRSELWWRMREALDPANNTGISLPPDRRLLSDLCAPTWSLSGSTIKVASREEILHKLGRSPDFGSAYILALIDSPKTNPRHNQDRARHDRVNRDPYADL